ncbi:hypothetical protein OHS81_06455 [Streptomyces sp. NBC_00400]|uniref:hypothetical protein n=1 Tax=Streptomyces sp. NBC_00400 TaxID=2975737 RepID=UPI002E2013F4
MRSSTTARTARRRTLRIAAAALTAAAGLTLTACSGSDAADAKSAGHTSTSSATAESTPSGRPGIQSSDGKESPVAEIGTKSVAAGKQSGGAQSVRARTGTPVRAQTLVDGSTAKIYGLGSQRYRAEIVSDGSVVATMETTGQDADAGLDANGMYVVLTVGGEIHSWMGGEHQGPGTFKLAGGWTAKVTKAGELRYRAQITGFEGVAATLETKGHDVGVDANGVYIVLSAGGVVSAHT